MVFSFDGQPLRRARGHREDRVFRAEGFRPQRRRQSQGGFMAAKVRPIPEGYHTISPYLVVSNAVQALEFYGRAFGAETRFKMLGPDGKSIAHAEMQMGNS